MADDFCKEFKFFSAIAAYCFFEKKPVIDKIYVNGGLLLFFLLQCKFLAKIIDHTINLCNFRL